MAGAVVANLVKWQSVTRPIWRKDLERKLADMGSSFLSLFIEAPDEEAVQVMSQAGAVLGAMQDAASNDIDLGNNFAGSEGAKHSPHLRALGNSTWHLNHPRINS